MRNKVKLKKNNVIFNVIYILCFLGAGIIGLLSGSFFAYDIFNAQWADILYILFIITLFVTAFVQETLKSGKISDIVFNAAVFLGGGTLVAVCFFVHGVTLFLMPAYSAVMLCIYLIGIALRVRSAKKAEADIKKLVGIASLLLFSLASIMTVNFVDDIYAVWSLIPAGIFTVIAAAVAFVVLRGILPAVFTSKAKGTGTVLLFVTLTFIVSFIYSFTSVGVINCVFDGGEPQISHCEVLEKKVSAGARTPRKYLIKIEIDGKDKWMDIPAYDYFEISEGDCVLINYYPGALGFPYYLYNDICNG